MTDYAIREIHEKKQIVTLDMSVRMMWMDLDVYSYKPKSVTEYSKLEELEGYEVSKESSKVVWKPDLYVHNLSDYKAFMDSLYMKSLKTMRTNYLDQNLCVSGPFLKYDIEAKVSFYCNFDLSNYPLDESKCKLRFGGEISSVAFKLDQHGSNIRGDKIFQIADLEVRAFIAEETFDIDTKTRIGLNIEVKRTLRPYILKYYTPCATIVFMSQLSFLIPLESLPGRVALVVTQFLTLTSLFIQQMVCQIIFLINCNLHLINEFNIWGQHGYFNILH